MSQPARLTIRLAGSIDAVPLQFFFDACLRRDYFLRRGQLREILTDGYHRVFIAEIDGILVGIAIVSRGARLTNVLIHPAYRGLGIGRALIDAGGTTEVRVKLDMSSGDPRGFYRALGFRQTRARNAKGNIVVMRRSSESRKPTSGGVE